ncbi:hypothetical protein MBH78_21910 [Oceanimonas sp. NS1]|nr:hypothetical protein [Oceanimonas sp. NS1]
MTVARHANRAAYIIRLQQAFQVGATVTGQGQAELLIEIAVVEVALPIHAHQAFAHHTGEVVGTEVVLQQLHVIIETAAC